MSQRPIRLGVVADDLTGANATGVRLAGWGMEVWSALTAEEAPRLEGHVQALALVTESRALPAQEAAHRVRRATAVLVEAGANLFGKRIDSTLRGNLGTELEAMMGALDAAGRPHLALVVPAYPASGRVVAGGFLLVHGVPVQETAAGTDPGAPVRSSRVQEVLREQTGLAMESLELDQVLRGPGTARAALEGAIRRGTRVVVADATTDAHIDTLVAATVLLETPVLSVDPGPFTGALARARLIEAGWAVPAPTLRQPAAGSGATRREGPAPGGETPEHSKKPHYLAGVVGSVTPLSLRQVERAARAGAACPVPVPVDALVAATSSAEADPATVRHAAREALDAALACLRRAEVPLLVTARSGQPLLPAQTAGAVAGAVGELVAALADEAASQGTPLDGLYLSGGDITVASCRALTSPVLRLEVEVEPLVAFARLTGGPWAGLPVVTKGGLVGDEEALVRCLRYLSDGP
ncbi:four-carbon acid sugar kinase family protein [Limnochorda pilosa]|uniref:Four-carbon acid sugar kinase family protein n=1 Tax=Limnochorda pilosa TaxID=1555112 RepID=A0A0K2SKW1_LIMPI|nr:four-carbon acid sugar kinase family protein [Limnochorda pilosa]BAS27751.1 hypothetical protein LIP_1910 [Limnochorda pilosa]